MAPARRLTDETENRHITSWGWSNWTLPSDPPVTITHEMLGFFPEIEITDPDVLFNQEKGAFEAMLPGLKQQYPRRYVAVHNGRVEIVGRSESEVVRLFFERFGDAHVYIGYVGDAEPSTYQISPFSF
jgi:hypothetical protein